MSAPSTEQVIYELLERNIEPTWDMLTDSLRINGEAYTEKWRATIYNSMYDIGVKADMRINRVLVEVAHQNPVHAVWDTLQTLPWDGQDHIGKLATYFTDAHEEIEYSDGVVDTVFGAFLRRWLIGCVARAHHNYNYNGDANSKTPQNRVLILGGGQGLGKSFFAQWIAGPFSKHFTDTKFQPEDSNMNNLLAQTFIWEIAEADAVFGRVNKNALKHVITQSTVRFKHPYGRVLVQKASLCNWIGTFNPDGPIFEDQQSRRWAIVLVDAINKAYSTEINVEQVWAQAYNLYMQGETYEFSSEEVAVADSVNKQFTQADHLEETMQNYFIVGDAELRIKPILISEVLSVVYKSDKDKCAKEAAYWLSKQGCEKRGNPPTWRGVCLNDDYPFHTDVRFKKIMNLIQENLDDNFGYNE